MAQKPVLRGEVPSPRDPLQNLINLPHDGTICRTSRLKPRAAHIAQFSFPGLSVRPSVMPTHQARRPMPELELIQSHMTQKQRCGVTWGARVLRVRSVSREEVCPSRWRPDKPSARCSRSTTSARVCVAHSDSGWGRAVHLRVKQSRGSVERRYTDAECSWFSYVSMSRPVAKICMPWH